MRPARVGAILCDCPIRIVKAPGITALMFFVFFSLGKAEGMVGEGLLGMDGRMSLLYGHTYKLAWGDKWSQEFSAPFQIDPSPKDEVSRSSSEQVKGKWRIYSSLAFTVSSGLAALLVKRAADDSYQKYLHSANPDRMEAYFDRAKDYDRIAGFLFSASQVGFLMIWYFALF